MTLAVAERATNNDQDRMMVHADFNLVLPYTRRLMLCVRRLGCGQLHDDVSQQTEDYDKISPVTAEDKRREMTSISRVERESKMWETELSCGVAEEQHAARSTPGGERQSPQDQAADPPANPPCLLSDDPLLSIPN